MIVNKAGLIEGVLCIVCGFLSIAEGIRVTVMKKNILFDVLGPGKYNVGLGIGLVILGLVYTITQRKEGSLRLKPVSKELRSKAINMVIILASYTVLIYFVGYLLASIVFFVWMFKVVGVKSWVNVLALSIIVSFSYYMIFVYLLNMLFPSGLFFRNL